MAQARILGAALVELTTGGRLVQIPITSAGGDALYIESKDIDFGNPLVEKYLDTVVFDLSSLGSVPTMRVSFGTRNSLNDAVTWYDFGYVDLNNPTIKPRLQSRFFKLKLEDEIPVSQWKLTQVDFYGHVCGKGRL